MVSSLHNSVQPLRKGDKSHEDDVWLPMWRGNKELKQTITHTQSSHCMKRIGDRTTAHEKYLVTHRTFSWETLQ